MNHKTVAIIGAGRFGSATGFLLKRAGYAIIAVASRTLASAEKAAAFIGAGIPGTDVIQASREAGLVVLATPDRAIQHVCETIAAEKGFREGALVVHASGAHTRDLLDSAKAAGAARAVIHPLQSIASREQGVKTLPGSYFRIEADPEALEAARDFVRAIGGIELKMPEWRSDKDSAALYHAGAVAVSNYFVALIDYGLKFYEALGADKKEALKAVLPLIRGTLDNIEAHGTVDALTGPIMRGDTQTVRDHLGAMQRRAPALAGLYKEMARQTVAVARDRGSITPDTAEELLTLLSS